MIEITVLGKAGASVAALPVKALLKRKTFRLRVAHASTREARRRGISVTFRGINRWLKREDTQEQLQAGGAADVTSALASLRSLVGGPNHEKNAREVLQVIFREFLAANDPARAVAISSEWTAAAIKSDGATTRTLIENISAPKMFDENLRKLHPWRASEAVKLHEQWPGISAVVQALAMTNRPDGLLAQWGTVRPEFVQEAPAEGLRWLAYIAGDYKASAASIQFLTEAIEQGAYPSGYLWARAALLAGEDEGLSRKFLAKSGNSADPLSTALRLGLSNQHAQAVRVLEGWKPNDPNDNALRSIILANCHVNLEQNNRAIAILVDHANSDPLSSGSAQRAAELLLNRGRYGKSDSPYRDYEQALSMAISARNSRRSWRGDAVPPILVALKAAVNSGDMEQAIRLTIAEGDGDATEDEATDPRLMRERAILLSMAGSAAEASSIAEDLADPFIQSTVAGFNELADGARESGTRHLLSAFDLAETDSDKMLIALALVEDGDSLPDLTELATRYPEQIAEFQRHHALLADGPDRVQLLRAHVHESPRLAIALANAYVIDRKFLDAARALERAATDFTLPRLMTSSAHLFMRAGENEEAVRVCEAAIAMAAGPWAGEFGTRAVLFEALAALNRLDDAIQQARRLVSLDPQDASARWALAQSLLRKGETESAWSAIAPTDDPIEPRSAHEVRLWVGLAVKYMSSSTVIRRSLEVMKKWANDEELVGGILAHLTGRLPGGDLAPSDLQDLNHARNEYLERFPDSKTLRAVTLDADSDSPLDAFAPDVKERYEAIHETVEQVQAGKAPLGVLSLTSISYAAVVISRAGGMVRSVDPRRGSKASQAASAIGRAVAIDVTAAVTIAQLDASIRNLLIGQFTTLHSTDEANRDALAAQEDLGLRSTLSIVWDPNNGSPKVETMSDEAAERLATLAENVVGLFGRTKRSPRPHLKSFAKVDDHALHWLATLDMAIESGLPMWCDDLVFGGSAAAEGVDTFSTVDLVRHLASQGEVAPSVRDSIEALLIRNFHVDLGFDRGDGARCGTRFLEAGRGGVFPYAIVYVGSRPSGHCGIPHGSTRTSVRGRSRCFYTVDFLRCCRSGYQPAP